MELPPILISKSTFKSDTKLENTNRLILSKPTIKDFGRYYEIHSDPQTNLFNPSGPMDLETAKKSFDEFVSHWSIHDFGNWAIKQIESDMIIGFGGLSYRLYGDDIKLNLGYRFDKDTWGKGYATELSMYAINYGLNELNMSEIFAIVRPQHAASIRVLEKCNMKLFDTLDDVPGQDQSLVYRIVK